MSKKQVFELRMASRNNDPGLIVGKFPGPVVPAFQECIQTQNEVNMYVKEEEVKEDDTLEVTSTNQHEISEAKALEIKNRKRKKNYRAKSEIILEQQEETVTNDDIGVSKPVNWVGNKVDTTVVESKSSSSSSSSSSSGTKYAILQIMSTGVGDKIQKHVNVLHVGDWFSFTRPSAARTEESLDDINAKFEARQRSQLESNKRYNKLVSGYRNSSRRGGAGDEEEVGGEEKDAPVMFGKTSASARSSVRALTEDGVDLDGAESNHWQDVDMATGVSDDEDDTGFVQAVDNDLEERTADVIDAYVNSSGGESDDDDEQEDDMAALEKKEKREQAQASLEHLESGARQLESAMEFKQKVLVSMKGKAKDTGSHKRKLNDIGDGGVAGGGHAETKSAMSSSALVTEHGTKLKKAKHVSIVKGEVTSKASPVYTIAASSAASVAAPVSVPGVNSSILSEENVRAYIKRHGGRVQSKMLLKEFKKSMKEMGPSAKDLYRSILIKLTKKEEDSIHGTMLMLK